jgi:hypothetical protein
LNPKLELILDHVNEAMIKKVFGKATKFKITNI